LLAFYLIAIPIGIFVTAHSAERALLRQQEILAKFGELALRSDSLDQILTEACRLVGEALETDLAKVMELQSDGLNLLVRAGVGWKPGVVGVVVVKASADSSEGFALSTGESVISDDIATETRFKYADFIKDHGVRAMVNVIIIGAEGKPPFGILQVDSRRPRHFSERDAKFLIGYANLIAAAVDRLRATDDMRSAQASLVAKEAELRALNETLEQRVLHRTEALAAEQATRRDVETQLRLLNRDLDTRVIERTARLQEINDRMRLLEQITHAIGQRQDVDSILGVVVITLQDQLPADFVGICLYDPLRKALTVAHIGVNEMLLGKMPGIAENMDLSVDPEWLARCVAGDTLHRHLISNGAFPVTDAFLNQGLTSLIMAPMMFENALFGVLVVARSKDRDFDPVDAEFFKQLGEHVGLAAHQSHLRSRLQEAYDNLKKSQKAEVARERLRAIGQMASGIAHDINNAISPLAVYNQLLLERRSDLDPELMRHLELVGRVTNDISATVGRLREFYRPDDDKEKFELVDLNLLIPQVVELTRARWSDMPQARGIVVKVLTALEANLPPVMGNASELREVMTNLIFNAVDAMPEGGTITVGTDTPAPDDADGVVRLEVADTGVGMDKDTRKQCLDAFFTTKGERGTGLGLAVVQHAAEHHKARIDILSAPGAGTRIRLDFPAAERSAVEKAHVAPARGRSLRILLIDDNLAVLTSMAFVMDADGHSATTAAGGQEGIDALQKAFDAGDRYDMIITDLGMPYVDGNQVALAAKGLFPGTPIVLLTGWGQHMDMGDTNLAHIDHVLSKPLAIDDLRAICAELPEVCAA
jgi:signal transduction histidine kinase/ActR/RegA family two-component response regulator